MGTPRMIFFDFSALYMRIYFIGMPASMVYNFGAAILRAAGDSRRPMY
jgi:Na+-driven multidrug efflux pump